MKKCFTIVVFFFWSLATMSSVLHAAPFSDTSWQEMWTCDGIVRAIAPIEDKIYIGGEFTQIGPYCGAGIPFDMSTGSIARKFPRIIGRVRAACPDGDGGWFIGGDFVMVGGLTKRGFAHILSNGSVDPSWNTDLRNTEVNTVYSIAMAGAKVYIGGEFGYVGGQVRNGLAALDAVTGNVLPWNPNADGRVLSIAVSGATVYAAGNFHRIGGKIRAGFGALDTVNGDAGEGNYGLSDVQCLAVSGNTVYIGGCFIIIHTTAHSDTPVTSGGSIYAVDMAAGTVVWGPKIIGTVDCIAISGSTLFVGGSFTSVDGQNRRNLAALNAATGDILEWKSDADSAVLSLAENGTTVYAAGLFRNIGGQSRNKIAALDATTGNVLPWNQNLNGTSVSCLAVNGTSLYAGGDFSIINPQNRKNIAVVDAITGNALDCNPQANHSVYSLAVIGTTVFAKGTFDSIGGQYRRSIAALDATTGDVLPWNPNPNGQVYSMEVSGTTVYVGGHFDSIGGQSRNNIAALDATTGNALAWNPNSNGAISSIMKVSGTTVYVGGEFDSIGGQSRNNIAALDATTGDVLPFNLNAKKDSLIDPFPVQVGIGAVNGTTVYAIGNFSSIGGQYRRYIAALDATTGNALAWNPKPNDDVSSIVVSGTTVYVGGEFDSIGGWNRNGIAAFDAVTGNALPWDPNANAVVCAEGENGAVYSSGAVVFTLAGNGTSVYASGNFTSISSATYPFFARSNGYSPSTVISPSCPGSITSPKTVHFSFSRRTGRLIYALPRSEYVSIRLYNCSGRLLSNLVNKHQNTGYYEVDLKRDIFARGSYIAVFKTGDYCESKLILLMK